MHVRTALAGRERANVHDHGWFGTARKTPRDHAILLDHRSKVSKDCMITGLEAERRGVEGGRRGSRGDDAGRGWATRGVGGRRRVWVGDVGGSADAVEPADGGAVASVAEGLELVVPGPAERQVEFPEHPQRFGVARRRSRPGSGPPAPSRCHARRWRRGRSRVRGYGLHRPPSTPELGSSVTSKRRCAQPRRAEVNRAPMPCGACQDSSVRYSPGAAGWSIQSSERRSPRTPPAAHSTCGHNALGAECTNNTPRVMTPDIWPSSTGLRFVFPNDLTGRATYGH